MATGEVARRRGVAGETTAVMPQTSVREFAWQVVAALASLRLTVVLFAASIFLVFVGTLAQKDHDISEVLHSYFRVWFAWIELRTFERLVQMFFKGVDWHLSGSLPFIGGKFLGVLLLANLIAAHAVRFKVAASGQRLAIGLGVLAVGLVAAVAVIASGMNDTLESELSPAFCHTFWQAFRGTLVLVAIAGANGLRMAYGRIRPTEWRLLLACELVLAAVAVWLLIDPTARPDDSGIRILWQLAKAGGAGLVLLLGTILVFRKRAGIVLLHGGVALMMLSEMWTAIQAEETRASIPEGGSVNYSFSTGDVELAVVDRAGAATDRVTVVPGGRLEANVGKSTSIEHADLPVKLRVLSWFPNAELLKLGPNVPNVATAGLGRLAFARPLPLADGKEENTVNYPAAYVELLDKADGKSIGTYLVSAELPEPQPFSIGERNYDVSLRFARSYWPFSIALQDFRRETYTGTNTPKSYSSLVELNDAERNVRREHNIWMNNPLRYGGLTFYQSSFDEKTEKTTVLQVVANAGWMAPYQACMLVVIGMFFHFSLILVRFIRRQAEVRAPVAAAGVWIFPAIVTGLAALFLLLAMRMPSSKSSEPQIYDFAKLPVSYQGRIKPYDTLARHSLQYLSGREQLSEKVGERDKRTPAIRWLLDVISGSPKADDYRVFRVENLDLLNTLGLEQRPGQWRYSANELRAKSDVLQKQADLAEAEFEAKRPLSLYQRKVRELANKIQTYMMLVASYRSPQSFMPEDQLREQAAALRDVTARMFAMAPHAIPPTTATTKWSPLIVSEFGDIVNQSENKPANETDIAMRKLLDAYSRDDVATFNQQLAVLRDSFAKYGATIDANTSELKSQGAKWSELLSLPLVNFEVFFNQVSPFFYCYVLYIFAFVLGALSWLGWTENFRKASNWVLWLTFSVHTLALLSRIIISGRPPVTNLYSSAIFIGWGAVLLALVIEHIYRLGVGNIVAAVVGFSTLIVAHYLSLDGDTMIVMQAVLDTQFWLATHVVCIAMGYATTYVAGLFGIVYILLAYVFPVLKERERHEIMRMCYGTLCFAIFFSFFGTVLGGLWADDSWGRFWGWDPKENGALIIVLYNALVLHARWGALVRDRGMAMLTVGGNIVVTWSWFGVNELGVGLHAYGASERATATWLLIFAMSQVAIIALAAVPQNWYQSTGGRRLQSR